MSKIIVALDFPNYEMAINFAKGLDPKMTNVKVGKELFVCAGPKIVEELQKLGFKVFLDLKFHDIPNTVAGAIKSCVSLGVWMVNIHLLGGMKMCEAALNAIANSRHKPLLIGVSVLTSLTDSDLHKMLMPSVNEMVLNLCAMADEVGLDGVVCSAKESKLIKENFNLQCITPGIRLSSDAINDQVRVITPDMAIKNGADYLVIGRPITQAPQPLAALEQFYKLSCA